MYDKTTSMRVSKKLVAKLKKLGKMGETYEDVVWKLIKGKRK